MIDHEAFPIQDRSIPSIPWAMIAPHEARARANHCGQSLRRLAERGGLSPDEAVRILDDREWSGRTFLLPEMRQERERYMAEQVTELKRRVEAWEADPDRSTNSKRIGGRAHVGHRQATEQDQSD